MILYNDVVYLLNYMKMLRNSFVFKQSVMENFAHYKLFFCWLIIEENAERC